MSDQPVYIAGKPIEISAPTEKKRWEELMKIKSMPISIAEKRVLKAQLENIPTKKLKGWNRVRWEKQRLTGAFRKHVIQRVRNLVFYKASLQQIEVRCGTSIVNVFLFIKWTAFLNLGIFFFAGLFLVLPVLLNFDDKEHLKDATCPAGFDANKPSKLIKWSLDKKLKSKQLKDCCTKSYEVTASKIKGIYHSPVVYGFYHIHKIKAAAITYDYAQAYALVPVCILLLCLAIMVRQISVGIKEVILAKEGEFYKYSNLVLSGWDHYTKDMEGAKFKKKILKHEMKLALKTEKLKVETTLRTRKQKWSIFGRRVLANVLVIAIQALIATIIFFISEFSINETVRCSSCNHGATGYGEGTIKDDIRRIAIQILPSSFISIINIIFPILLRHISKLEKYSPSVQVAWSLFRTLFVRLLSLAFAGYKYYTATYCDKRDDTCTFCEHGEVLTKSPCWESVIGVQLFVLIMIDFTIKLIMVFVVGGTRRLLANKCESKIFQRMGKMKFNVVRHSLDIVNIQCLAWFFYFSPFIPLTVAIYCVLVFYLKKFQVLYICKAVPDTYRTTRTTTIFVVAKVISFCAAAIVIGLVLNYLEPSRGCGPFREHEVPWEAVRKIYDEKNQFAFHLVRVLSSPGVTTPVAIILLLLAYYYYSIAQANKSMVENLRHHLILEGHDKQYLFARLNALRTQGFEDGSVSMASTGRFSVAPSLAHNSILAPNMNKEGGTSGPGSRQRKRKTSISSSTSSQQISKSTDIGEDKKVQK